MAKQKIVWTVLPFGRIDSGPLKGRLRVSVVVSPRLTPQTAQEQALGAPGYAEFHNWPKTLQRLKLQLQIAGVPGLLPLQPLSDASAELWEAIFSADTPVAGFKFTDMSRVNLRSYAVRNVLGFVREHYGKLALSSGDTHPKLLPWRQAEASLKGLLGSAGTTVVKQDFGHSSVEQMVPGFDRFFDPRQGLDERLRGLVFGPRSRYQAPVVGIDGQPGAQSTAMRVLPPDWNDPAGGGSDQALMSQFHSADEYTLYQANRFYKRSTPTAAQLASRRPDLKNVAPPIELEDFDFHRIVASLGDVPQVLRSLGLVIDCALPDNDALSAALAGAARIEGVMGLEVAWGDPHDAAADAYPRCAFRATATRFVPRERTPDHADGLLRLGEIGDPTLGQVSPRARFDVFQLDPDGAALKTTNFVLTAQNLVSRSLKPRTHGEVTYSTGERQPVAALRSGGLGVSRHGRAAQVALDAAAAALKNAALDSTAAKSRQVVLFTEDVLRGYRVDVQQQGRWLSLCRRIGEGTLTRTGRTLPLAPDEGYVKGASTSGDGSDDHYLHEALFRWTGWSLVAARPGRKISAVEAADSGLQGEEVTDSEEVADNGNGLAARFRAQPGSLPRLRFGQDYRLRARAVDLAGNSLAADDPGLADLEQATQPVSYLRFEPVDPPALVHRHRVSEGESLERLVLRSNFNADPKAYLSSPAFKAATQLQASADFEYVAQNQRHVVPPKAAQLQCEQHGMFDNAIGSGAASVIRSAYRTAAREAGTLYDALPGAKIELITPAGVKTQALTTAVPPALPSAQAPTGGRLVGGQYIVHREERLTTPYLSDPAAGGFALRGESRDDMARIGIVQPMSLGDGAFVVRVPQTEELVLIVENGKAWPDTQGLRIVLDERAHTLADGPCAETFPDDGRPKWDAGKRVLTLFMRKGHVARLRYASFVDKRHIDAFGLPRWSDTVSQRAFIAELALLGVHWMVTPYRALVLVHATQQPVCTPVLHKVSAPRPAAGQTFTDLDAAVQLHGPSTGKFEVVAEWSEWRDDPQQARPVRNTVRGTLAEIPLPENHANNFMLASAANAVQLPPPNSMPPVAEARLRGNRHEFGDTRFRLVRYRIEATTRFREYLPAALFAQRDQITRLGLPALETTALLGADDDAGAPVLFNVGGATPNGTRVLSTQAPDVPRVVYAVPTFRWVQTLGAAAAAQSSTRLGNALRVYLERPWFSSGDGELLGVVLLGDGSAFDSIPEAMMPFVTQWGLDPLFDSAAPKAMGRAADFTARVASETLPLLENGTSVHVVGHRVQWDDARRLWFCDIELDPGLATYMPFVRLALVRYQPQSIGGMKLSRVVLGDFAQLLPRRAATVQRQGQGRAVEVKVRGPVPVRGPMLYSNDSAHLNISFVPPPGTELEVGRNKIELVLQTRDAAIDSDLAWNDVHSLASALALPPGASVDRVPGASLGLFATPALSAATGVTRAGSLGELQRFDDRLELPAAAPRAGVTAVSAASAVSAVNLQAQLAQATRFDPVIWQAAVNLPAFSGPGRLVLREFERYYTDRTVPERRGDTVYRRRVVEERLVYSEFFPLN